VGGTALAFEERAVGKRQQGKDPLAKAQVETNEKVVLILNLI